MTPREKTFLRLAVNIHERFVVPQSSPTTVWLPIATWQRWNRLVHMIGRAKERGWNLAVLCLQRDLQFLLRQLRGDLVVLEHSLDTHQNAAGQVTVGDVYADLIALQEEFDDLTFDLHGRTLSVTTESIELEGVHLGAFKIRLNWTNVGSGGPHEYEVIAQHPNPPAADDSVTHPHVKDESVCEGEASRPIRDALDQCRLYDFFLIVANLLRSYNADSPYVSLSDWEGVQCADCDITINDDDWFRCNECDTRICLDCYWRCPACSKVFCGECMSRCENCNGLRCPKCQQLCRECNNEVCGDCLKDDERCNDCHEKQQENQAEVAKSDDSGSPIHADGVGKTAVSA